MTQTLDIDNAEKQVFRLAIFEDGIWEIYLGIILYLMSFYSCDAGTSRPGIECRPISGCDDPFGSYSVDRQETHHLTPQRIGEVQHYDQKEN